MITKQHHKTIQSRSHILLAIAVAMTHAVTLVGEIIPTDRRINWQPGIPGGIPNRTTIFANVTQAPYNADNSGNVNAATAIQNAINACPSNQVVFIPAGTYQLSSGLTLKHGITLRGAGRNSTRLRYTGSSTPVIRFVSGSYNYSSTSYPITGGFAKGSANISTTDNDWTSGDLVLVDEMEDNDLIENDGSSGSCTWCGRSNGDRCHGQIVEVLSRTPTSTTITPALYSTFKSSSSPQGVKIRGPIRMAGLESLAITNVAGAARDTIFMEAAYRCWIKDCDLAISQRRHTWLNNCFQTEIRDSSFHHGNGADWSSAYGPDRAYCIFMGQATTACLVENNDFWKVHFAVAFEGGGTGNVIAYNFVTNIMYIEGETPQPAIGNHGAHPIMNLWEGNVLRSKIMMDNYWGSSSHTTLFRNKIANMPSNNGQQAVQYVFVLDIWKNNRYLNVVGNVLGTVGMESAVDAPSGYPYGGKYIYRLGFTDANDNSTAGNDTLVTSTMLRHGNWDSVTRGVLWDPGIADHNLPASLYLTGRPAWWGNLAWPAVGPDLSPTESLIPAQARYYGTVVGSKPEAPTNLRLANP